MKNIPEHSILHCICIFSLLITFPAYESHVVQLTYWKHSKIFRK